MAWEVKKLGEVLKLEYGKPLDKSKRNPSGKYPVYGANGEKDRSDEYYYNKRSIIVGRKGSAGEINFTEEKFWPLDVTYFVTYDDKKYDLFFIYHLLSRLNLPSLAKGVKPGINRNDVYSINVQIPPLPIQKRIVATLDEAFEKLSKAKENAEKNLINAKEVFESYLQSVFENKGEGWEEKKLIEICTFINGRAFNKKELLNKGKYVVLRVGNFFTNKHWYYSDLELSEDKYCDKGDLLYAWSASFGPRIWGGEKVIYHYHIWKVIPNLELVSKEFLFILLEWDTEKIKLAQGTGTTMIHVSKGSMEARIIPLPSLKDQQIIVSKTNSLSAETKKLESIYNQKLTDLEELKQSILQKAFKGELTEVLV